MKRILFSLLMLLTFFAFNPAFDAAFAADKATKNTSQTTCTSCLKTCEDALKYCEKKGGKHVDKEHIKTLKDCIALCRASSDLGSRDSALLAKVRGACAEACAKCAKSCEALNDPKLKDCVQSCNDCAKSCASDAGDCCKEPKKS